MDTSSNNTPMAGDTVVVEALPPGLLEGLPKDDQAAIAGIIGKAVLLVGYDDRGKAELEFVDSDGAIHSIWVSPGFVRRAT